MLEDLPPGRWDALPPAAAGVLSAVRDAAARVPARRSGGERREDPEGATGRKLAQAALDEVADTAVRLLGAFDEPDPAKRRDVVWLAEQGPDGARHRVLRAAPLCGRRAAAGAAVRARHRGAHLGDADARRARSTRWPGSGGCRRRAAGRRRGGTAPTTRCRTRTPRAGPASTSARPFEHARSGILYVAKRLPPPGRDGLPPAYLDEIAGLVEAAGGRTLGLFSSMRAAKQATEALRGRLDTPLLCQGDDATMLLVKRFAEDEATSLFGTLSLWQGVDVPGPVAVAA